MTTNETKNDLTIEADPALPTIKFVRDFDAPRDRVFRAWIDPELAAKWLGPKDTEMRVDEWEGKTGGHYRYSMVSDGEEHRFYGSFHEVRPNERLVQTFTWEGYPDGVSLDTMTFEDLGDGRTRTIGISVVDSIEARDMIISSGMEVGVREGYEKLDALLADA